MTFQQELDLLSTAYAAIIANPVASYQIDGRSITYQDAQWMATRIGVLRTIIARQAGGGTSVSQFRRPE